METVRLVLGVLFIAAGIFVFIVATAGLFRFHYVLNRVHVAAKCDSLAALSVCVGLMFFNGTPAGILKLALIAGFIWLTNPIASHLVCKIEMETNPRIKDECRVEERP